MHAYYITVIAQRTALSIVQFCTQIGVAYNNNNSMAIELPPPAKYGEPRDFVFYSRYAQLFMMIDEFVSNTHSLLPFMPCFSVVISKKRQCNVGLT